MLINEDIDYSENDSISLMLIEADYLFDHFPSHIYGALRPTEKNIFDNHLVQLFSGQTQSRVTGKKRSANIDPANLDLRTFKTSEMEFKILSPKQGTDLSSSESDSRFTLILDQYSFNPYQVGGGSGSYAGHEQEVQNRIRFNLSYLIWDNHQKKEIGWGKVTSNHRLYRENMAESYRSAISSAFQKIVDVSPFQPA